MDSFVSNSLSSTSFISATAELLPNFGTGSKIKGFVKFSQTEGGKAKINLQLTGLAPNSLHGWHIHDQAVKNQNCSTAGLHFNPKNVVHGAPDADIRHYGDFGNFQADSDGHIDYTIEDRLASLFGEFKVQGKGVVIHELQDDLGLVNNDGSRATGNAGGRLACGNIVDDKVPIKTASVDILPNAGSGNKVQGTVTIEQAKGSDLSINLQLSGLPPNTLHGWHIHENPVLNQNCSTSGGHFNPLSLNHGAPDAAIRHFGDLGNFKSDNSGNVDTTITDKLASLFGEYTISGRGLVIHEKEDDLGLIDNEGSRSVGNAGGRLACGNISGELESGKSAEETNQTTNGKGALTSDSTGVSLGRFGFFWMIAALFIIEY